MACPLYCSCPECLVSSLFVGLYGLVHVSVTGLVNPLGSDAVQWKIRVVTRWKMSSVMLVNVRVGFTPVQLLFGHPAVAPLTDVAAVRVAGRW